MWAFITSPDFLTNLAAGVLIFGLELLLVVTLLPWFIRRRVDLSWQPARKKLWQQFDKILTDLVLSMEAMSQRVAEGKMEASNVISELRAFKRRVPDVIPIYANALDPRLMEMSADMMNQLNDIVSLLERYVRVAQEQRLRVWSTHYDDAKAKAIMELLDQIRMHLVEHDRSWVDIELDTVSIERRAARYQQTRDMLLGAIAKSVTLQR